MLTEEYEKTKKYGKKKLKLREWKKWMKKKRRYDWCASYPIDILGAQTVFLEEDC